MSEYTHDDAGSDVIYKEYSALKAMGAMQHLPPKPERRVPIIEKDDYHLGIAARFRRVASIVPENVAIYASGQSITYKELDQASDHLACQMIDRELIGSNPVVIGTEDPVSHIIGIFATLKAGGYYLPLSWQLPDARKEQIFKAVNASVAIATTQAEDKYLNRYYEVLSSYKVFPQRNYLVAPVQAPAHAAYVLFTSGSTGKPKGVVQTQENLLRNTAWQTEALSIDEADRFSQIHAESTMGAVRATLNSLLNGATLCPFSISNSNLSDFEKWLLEVRPSVLHSAASFFRVFAKAFGSRSEDVFDHVRLMILGGEAVVTSDFDLFREVMPSNCYLVTGLGSTETTTVRMMCLPKNATPKSYEGRLPLGFSVPGTTVRLVDPGEDDKFKGSVGELEIESDYLFAGYWPLQNGEPSRITKYRMGDLGFCSEDGLLFHFGRKDNQVKIRGNRVDLLEIEHVVRDITGVSDVCLVVQKLSGSDVFINLFVVPVDETAVTKDKLRYFLRKFLPLYMMPNSIQLLDEFPRMAGGKLDVSKLKNMSSSVDGEDAISILEEGFRKFGLSMPEKVRTLLECFEETSFGFFKRYVLQAPSGLHMEQIHFRDLQIDSLSALEICLNIEKKLGVILTSEQLLSHRGFSTLLKEVGNE